MSNCIFDEEYLNNDFLGSDYQAAIVDEFGWYICPQCAEGYYWEDATLETPGFCKSCYEPMKGCMKCFSENRCVRCDDGLIPLADETGCMEPILHCVDNPHNYTKIGNKWHCENCAEGYFRNYETGACDACAI